MKDYNFNEVVDILYDIIDALLIVSSKEDEYKAVKCSDIFSEFIDKQGSYKKLVEKLCFHISDNNKKIVDEYRVFLPKMCEFKEKTARKINFEIKGVKYLVQMVVIPFEQENDKYIIMLYNLDKSEFERDIMSDYKVKTIQETYLFSMYADLNKDTTSSINVSEISDEDVHYEVKYSEWRMMIVNMIWPDDKDLFLSKTDPEYLRANLRPAKTLSFDCQMKNLEGQYIWVKLIFGRTDTTSEQDFRFVFMVQNIHENSMQLFDELKKFEKLASHDSLTGIYNHGRIETELNNAIVDMNSSDRTISLMMFDIDFFKKINDTFGHAVGDEVLKEFVECINSQLEGKNVEIGRWGGEEFVCICYDMEKSVLRTLAEEVREAVANRNFNKIGNMTCSVGLAYVEKNDNVKDAFERLDKALYEAKSSGRNCVRG